MNSFAKRCKSYGVLFAVLFVAALLVAIYYCNLKTGFHVDELASRIVFIFHIFFGKTIWMPTG